jgi:hypothetical protein
MNGCHQYYNKEATMEVDWERIILGEKSSKFLEEKREFNLHLKSKVDP